MSDITITKKMKISTLQEDFLKEFGLTLRVYEGRSFASSSQTLDQLSKRAGGNVLSISKNMKVGNVEKKFDLGLGLKVEVAGSDNSYLCENELTLKAARQEDENRFVRKDRKLSDPTVEGPSVERELALLRVNGTGENRVEALRIAEFFRASVVDSTLESFICQITGAPEKIEAFSELLTPLGLSEVARTGVAILSRGR